MMLEADPAGIEQAARILSDGGLVAVPTETVYGLAARADRAEAVGGIYRAKGRPSFNPLIVHVADLSAASALAQLDANAEALAEAFWPGPLTMVLPRQDDAVLAPAVSAGLPTLAIRCPAHPVMRALLPLCDFPLAAPSANASGSVSPTRAAHVVASLGDRIDAVLDGGACEAGLESTIVALREEGQWQVLRPGPVTPGQIAKIIGSRSSDPGREGIEAPGQMASHYAPGKPLRLNARTGEPDEFHIGFGKETGDFSLSLSGDLDEAATRLYDALHAAASSPKTRISVSPIPERGIGIAINDRLSRAAS